MVGKDILRFHAIYWPAFLMAADLAPPKRVFAHGWWTNEGQKISKSLGNIIEPFDLVARYGLDQVRYFLLREVPFGNDGDFSHRAIVGRINGDLANDFGNLAQRVLSMIHKNCGGAVPALGEGLDLHADARLLDSLIASHEALDKLRDAVARRQAFNEALETVWAIVREANRYVDSEAPWALRKTDPDRMASVLYVLAEAVRQLAILLQPFMPDSCGQMLDQLAVPEDRRDFKCLNDGSGIQHEHALVPGTALPKPQGVFPRFVEAEEEGAA